jgi:hypothetical protein
LYEILSIYIHNPKLISRFLFYLIWIYEFPEGGDLEIQSKPDDDDDDDGDDDNDDDDDDNVNCDAEYDDCGDNGFWW